MDQIGYATQNSWKPNFLSLILNTYLDYFFLSAVAISLYSAIYSEQQNNVPKWHNKPKKPIKPEFEDDTENEIWRLSLSNH